MKIVGLDDISTITLQQELQNGAKFVTYSYCISIIIMTFRRSSDIYYIRPQMGSVGKGFVYTLISLLVGWWGIPWGPIYTIGALVTNLRGGKDITQEVVAAMMDQGQQEPA
jgi:hypothetical protein